MRTTLTRQVHAILRPCLLSVHSRAALSTVATAASAPTASAARPPTRTALLFPGQGSQRCGASVRELEQEWGAIVRPVWQELDETLQRHLSRTLKDGLMSELQSTELAQPAILAHSYALWLVLRSSLGLQSAADLCDVALGHSLGEYTALVVAGSLDFASAVRLVHARGSAMKHATREGEGGMLALLCDSRATSLHIPSIEELLQHAREATKLPVQIANLNSPFQIVISGHRDALDFVKAVVNGRAAPPTTVQQGTASVGRAELSRLSRGIMKAVALDVSGPFHSRLMAPAEATLADALSKVTFHTPSVPIIFNVHAHASVKTDKFADYLRAGLLSPVAWHSSLTHALLQRNVHSFVELGPSTPLSAMLRSTAARLEKQGRVIDPTLHGADVTRSPRAAEAALPHPSILPLIVPRPRVILDDGTRTSDKDAESILAGAAQVWGAVRATGAHDADSMRALIHAHEQSARQYATQ